MTSCQAFYCTSEKGKCAKKLFCDYRSHPCQRIDWVTWTPLKPWSLICIYICILVCNTILNGSTTGVTNGAWTAKIPNPSEAPEFTSVFVGICVAWSLVFCVVFSGFVLFLLLIALSFFHGFWFLIIHLVS